MKNFSNFTEAYRELLQDVYTNPDFESAPRGQKIREKLGFTFKLTNPRNRLPYLLVETTALLILLQNHCGIFQGVIRQTGLQTTVVFGVIFLMMVLQQTALMVQEFLNHIQELPKELNPNGHNGIT